MSKPDEPAKQKVRALLAAVKLVQRSLNGDGFLAGKGENAPESISDHVSHALRATSGAIAVPTGNQKKALDDAGKALAVEIAKLREIAEKELPALDKVIEANGGPAIPGKLPGK